MKTRIRQPSSPDVNNRNDALFIAARNKDVKKLNDEHMVQVDGEEFVFKAEDLDDRGEIGRGKLFLCKMAIYKQACQTLRIMSRPSLSESK